MMIKTPISRREFLVRTSLAAGAAALGAPAFAEETKVPLGKAEHCLFIWLGGMSVGMSRATAVVVAAVAGCAIFLFVRIYGEDDPRRPW